ncbi:adhesin [Stenotrophomonas sp. PS02298]|uniref:adhesin n=1 Tax=Stenotrophomonas sp. PS02298 TaxID=2991424 RepID=UPI00249B86C8|nr:adhesin [Stenotrophomonas sp. PS02298]
MKAIKWNVLAMAVSALTLSAAANAADDQNATANINHQHAVTETRTNTNTNTNINTNVDTDIDLKLDAAARLRYNETHNITDTRSNTETTSTVTENVQKTSNISADERKEKNNHGVDVNLEKDIRLSSDVNFSGDPTITGNIDLDSAAIALIDNRQSVSNNQARNGLLDNTASIADDVGSEASGNLGFNVAAGDNNTQDNAAALSAADASFSFGMADAEVFVNQAGMNNMTWNHGVTNAAGIGDNAFSGASGNIGVNVTSGNNNEQKNALAASVATAAYATSTISSNQSSSGNKVENSGYYDRMVSTINVSLGGKVTGTTKGSGTGEYAGTGNSYQKTNFYPDNWNGDSHPAGGQTGHSDWDNQTQGAVANPNRPGVGGMAWDTDEKGNLKFSEMGTADLTASLSGQVTTVDWVAVNATNTASLSGSAFSNASGNIGVNVSSGTGNLQANSLALAVAQPSTGGGGGTGNEP